MIYYVEDDTNIRELALYALKQAGLEAKGFASAEPFREALARQLPDLVLLDIMLPGTDGLTLLRELRNSPCTRDIPVMMLTAKGTEYDTVYGLDAGADDYLAKPFGMMELVSRTNALLRRAARPAQGKADGAGDETAGSAKDSHDVLVCGPIRLDAAAHDVTVGGVPVDLTVKEFDLLQKLMQERGHVLTRAQLLESVWDFSFAGETRTVDTHVQTLRHKLHLACPGAEEFIQTIRGVGYRLKADD